MDDKDDVLVVEDDKTLNKLLCHYVKLAGHPVRSAMDGSSALLAAQARVPMLVLLDLMLPDTTGFEVCTQLKRDDRTRDATVVIVTALDDQESRQRGLECGATEYIVKPFPPDRLFTILKQYVG